MGSETARDMVIVMSSRPGSIAAEVDAGTRPDAEYLDLMRRHRASLYCYDELDGRGHAIRGLVRLAGPSLALSILSVFRFSRRELIVATGEDIGLWLALVHGIVRRRRRRCPIAVTGHGSFLNSRYAWVIGLCFRRRRDVRFLCLSDAVADSFVTRARLKKSQVVTVGYGIDATFFRPPVEERADGFLVASAGMASRDYVTLIEAMRDGPGELRVAADSAWLSYDLDLGDLEVPSNVEVRSYGDYLRLRELYAAADVVAVPLLQGRHASGYAVVGEAMAMGRAVVVSDTYGRSDFIVDGVSGRYVPVGDVGALRDELHRLADHPAEAAALGRQARAAIEASGTLQHYSDRIADAAHRLAVAVGAGGRGS